MATAAQIAKLRRKVQDYYNKRTGQLLTAGEYAFTDDELTDIIDDAAAEATDGAATAESMSPLQESWCMILSRADAILQIAQDESRRIKWQTNNEIIDPSAVGDSLVKVAEALRKRYEDARKRKLEQEIKGVSVRPTGGVMSFNSTVKPYYERNFDNQTVRRNTTPDHRY